jgi:hypothetical protein
MVIAMVVENKQRVIKTAARRSTIVRCAAWIDIGCGSVFALPIATTSDALTPASRLQIMGLFALQQVLQLQIIVRTDGGASRNTREHLDMAKASNSASFASTPIW